MKDSILGNLDLCLLMLKFEEENFKKEFKEGVDYETVYIDFKSVDGNVRIKVDLTTITEARAEVESRIAKLQMENGTER